MPNYQRLTDYLKHYWDSVRGERLFPSLEAIDMMALEPEFRKDCFLLVPLDQHFSQHNVRALFMGEHLNKLYNTHDERGVSIKNVTVRFLDGPNSNFSKVLETKQPMVQNVEIPLAGGTHLMYRQILLPLGPTDSKPINAILGGMRYKKQ